MSRVLKIFFSGIAGSGVSAIASFMADRGNLVFGSDRVFDRNPDSQLSGLLTSKGITIVPQDGRGIDSSFDLAVFSTAVESDHPELITARSLGVPIKTRPEYLAEIVSEFKTIAVAGTSGKSTTAGMLAFLMQRLGMHPNFIGGGRVKQFQDSSNPGNALSGNSDYLVIEACESDGSIVNYWPLHSIIMNLELDHQAINATASMFRKLMHHTTGKIILNADDKYLAGIPFDGATTLSIHTPSDYQAKHISYDHFSSSFIVRGCRFTLPLPGKYNIYNALSCIAMLSELGAPLTEISSVLREFKGIVRRFDILRNDSKGLVIDDYAHNPHKIESLMETVSRIRDRICYIFQPHGFGPTRMMREEYIRVLSAGLRPSDHLILLPIYYAGGTASKDISSKDIADGVRAAGKSAEVITERKDVLSGIHTGKTYVIFGARDETLSDLAKNIALNLS